MYFLVWGNWVDMTASMTKQLNWIIASYVMLASFPAYTTGIVVWAVITHFFKYEVVESYGLKFR